LDVTRRDHDAHPARCEHAFDAVTSGEDVPFADRHVPVEIGAHLNIESTGMQASEQLDALFSPRTVYDKEGCAFD
jgi:hypothetical protein